MGSKCRWFFPAICYGILIVCISFVTSCTKVCFQAENLNQPVMLNKTSYLYKDNANFTLNSATTFNAQVSHRHATASSPGYRSTTTNSQTNRVNEVETRVVELIGGDNKKVITDMSFDVEVLCINALFAIATSVAIKGNGTVQDIIPNTRAPVADSPLEIEKDPGVEITRDTIIESSQKKMPRTSNPASEILMPQPETVMKSAVQPELVSHTSPQIKQGETIEKTLTVQNRIEPEAEVEQ